MADTNETVDKAQQSDSTPTSSSTGNDANTVGELADPQSEQDLAVEAVQNLQQGKRHLIVSDYRSAVASLEEACKLLDSCYGTGAFECGDAYLQYGTALFELARAEEGIIDGVVKVDGQILTTVEDEEDDSESQEDDAEDEGQAGDEEEAEAEAQADPPVGEPEENEAEAKASPEAPIVEEKPDIDLTQPSTSKGENAASNGDKSDEEEEVDNATNVEIAWEVLTLAQDIFSRADETKENRLNLAETLQKLAEISIEWENNENAVYLLNECLALRKEFLEPDDRLIAVAYHYLGIAFSFKCDYDNANSCFESALGVIELRIKNLKEKNLSENDQSNKDAYEREIKQLEELIPELRGKSDDMKEQVQSQFKTLESLEKETEQEESKQAKLQASPVKPVNNISHLIKRKAIDESVPQNGTDVSNKKARSEVNSSATPDDSNSKSAAN